MKSMGLSLYPSVWSFCTPVRNLWCIFGHSHFLMVPMASDSSSSRGMIFISLIHTSQNMQLPSQLPQSFHRFIDKKFICLRQRNLPNTLLLNFPSSFMDMPLSSGAALLDGSFLEYSRNCLKSLLSLGVCKPLCTAAWCRTMSVSIIVQQPTALNLLHVEKCINTFPEICRVYQNNTACTEIPFCSRKSERKYAAINLTLVSQDLDHPCPAN